MRSHAFLLLTIMCTFSCSWFSIAFTQSMPCAADQGAPGRGPFRKVPRDDPAEGCGVAGQSIQTGRTQLTREGYLQIDKDSSELLRLATELKRMIAQSNQQILSVEIASRAERIEKLSKGIKTKVRRGY